jgi:hypothetical protein
MMKGRHLEQAGSDLDYEGLHQLSTLLLAAGSLQLLARSWRQPGADQRLLLADR